MVATSSDPGQLWAAVLGQLQMQVTKPNFDTWLKHTSGLAYSDSEFVVGKSNELAHAAAMAVARQPGQLYNPLVSMLTAPLSLSTKSRTPMERKSRTPTAAWPAV